MTTFGSFSGTVTTIDNFRTVTGKSLGCYKLMTVRSGDGNVVNFIISPSTYFVDHIMISVGNIVIGFYDANAPVPLIYPPQYQAIVISKLVPGQNVKVDHFNEHMVSSDNTLMLNINPFTQIMLENGQAFNANPANHNLIVVYGPTTRSIPAQTTPNRIIVMCPKS
jgi:hypothetical protein